MKKLLLSLLLVLFFACSLFAAESKFTITSATPIPLGGLYVLDFLVENNETIVYRDFYEIRLTLPQGYAADGLHTVPDGWTFADKWIGECSCRQLIWTTNDESKLLLMGETQAFSAWITTSYEPPCFSAYFETPSGVEVESSNNPVCPNSVDDDTTADDDTTDDDSSAEPKTKDSPESDDSGCGC